MENKKIKLFVYSDGIMANTGFGTSNKNLLLKLLKTNKYEIHHLCINWYGDPHEFQTLKDYYAYPMRESVLGHDRFLPLLMEIKPDLLFVLNDFDAVGHIPPAIERYRELTGNELPFVLWFPVDGEPIYPENVEFLKRFVDHPVVISKYGNRVLERTDPDYKVDQVYHGIDFKTFKKLPKAKITELKESLGNKFVVLMVGVNQLRKQYPIAFEAFKEFSKDKEDVLLLLHTQQQMNPGWDLNKLRRLFGINDKSAFTDGIRGPKGIPAEDLNLMYNVADVYLSTSCGEGFNFCNMEAMATGTPVIYADNTSVSELIDDAGIKIPTNHFTIFPNRDRELVRPIPDTRHVIDALELMYSDHKKREEYGKKALTRAKYLYDSGDCNWDKIAEYFDEHFIRLVEDKNNEELELEEIL